MKYFLILILPVIFMLSLACTESTGNDKSNVEFNPKTTGLEVKNNTSHTIYYFIVESGFAALIDWAPGFNGPNLDPGESIVVPYSEISNGSEESVKEGDSIICYWWNDTNMENPEVNSVSITL
jgi:hypothetical protein